MKLYLTHKARDSVRHTSPNQVWAFVCENRRRDAYVVEAHISVDTAKRRARLIGGCVRMGHVVWGSEAHAETL
jgi:hypothetical protein